MLTIDVSEFSIQVDEGAIKNVGAVPKTATVKQYGIESATVREYGDDRVKLVFADDGGNDVEVALFPEDVLDLAADVAALAEDSPVFE
ncbi:MAG: hypothetical protein ABEJ59_04960 [Halanaeroarchaeum sp.]